MAQENWDSFKIKIAQHMLHVTRTGQGSGKPVVLMLHGHTDHGLCWTNLARDLEADYDCIMPDMVGHGLSSRLNGSRTLNTMVAEISSLIYMLGVEKMTIVGHSMGAQLAAMVAAAIPNKVTAIVLEDPPWGDATSADILSPNRPIVQQWIADIERWKRTPISKVMQERAAISNWDKTDLRMYAESRQQCDVALFGGLKWNALLHWESTLKRVRCPILLITGGSEHGALVDRATAERCLRINKNVTEAHWPAANHHIRRFSHGPVSRKIKAFI